MKRANIRLIKGMTTEKVELHLPPGHPMNPLPGNHYVRYFKLVAPGHRTHIKEYRPYVASTGYWLTDWYIVSQGLSSESNVPELIVPGKNSTGAGLLAVVRKEYRRTYKETIKHHEK